MDSCSLNPAVPISHLLKMMVEFEKNIQLLHVRIHGQQSAISTVPDEFTERPTKHRMPGAGLYLRLRLRLRSYWQNARGYRRENSYTVTARSCPQMWEEDWITRQDKRLAI